MCLGRGLTLYVIKSGSRLAWGGGGGGGGWWWGWWWRWWWWVPDGW